MLFGNWEYTVRRSGPMKSSLEQTYVLHSTRTATEMDGTLHTDLLKSETIRENSSCKIDRFMANYTSKLK